MDKYYEEESYRGLSAVQKQQAALQDAAFVSDETDVSGFSTKIKKMDIPDLNEFESSYEISCNDGISLEENAIIVSNPASAVHIHTKNVENCERYVEWKNLWYLGDGIATIAITDSKSVKTMDVAAENSTRYAGIHDVICNLGFNQESACDYDIYFSKPGK